MIEEHINERELICKIEDLFEYRLFPNLFSLNEVIDADAKAIFHRQLVDLQSAIYYLDAHLEANWELNQEVLQWHWNNISSKLSAMNIPINRHHEYVNHIRKYEKHETELRVGKSPLRFDMEYFYFYKSCDVKLLRRLIFEKLSLGGAAGSLSDWRYYDLVTEVNDDVEDVFEDLDFINGNRFLISIHTVGKQDTFGIFNQFLDQISDMATERYHANVNKNFAKTIFDITQQRISETKELMRENIQKISPAELEKSTLLIHQMSL